MVPCSLKAGGEFKAYCIHALYCVISEAKDRPTYHLLSDIQDPLSIFTQFWGT